MAKGLVMSYEKTVKVIMGESGNNYLAIKINLKR
jgi:hypothetical protein